jgi:hypothetical protein
MGLAVVLYVIHRWGTGKTAVDAKTVVEAAFVILVIAMLDQGSTEPIAKGFAWLFLVVAAYNVIPVVSTATKAKSVQPKPGANIPTAPGFQAV